MGVYATKVELPDGKIFPSVTNVGKNPTFIEKGHLSIESHLLDEKLDLYGVHLKLHFFDRIRDEFKFSSSEELVRQIKLDIKSAKEVFLAH